MNLNAGDLIRLNPNPQYGTGLDQGDYITLLVLKVEHIDANSDGVSVVYRTVTLYAPEQFLQKHFVGPFTSAGEQNTYSDTYLGLNTPDCSVSYHPGPLTELELKALCNFSKQIKAELGNLQNTNDIVSMHLPPVAPEDNTRKLTLGEL